MLLTKPVRLAATLAVLGLSAVGCTNASTTSTAPSTPSSDAPASSSSVDSSPAELLPADIKAKGVFTVASDASYAPFEYFDTDNKTMIGLDIDLTDALGKTLGLEVKHVNAGFDTILPGLSSSKYDAGASAFTVTDERRQVVDFVQYVAVGTGIAVADGNPESLSLDDPTSLCGRTVTAQKGSIQGIDVLPQLSKDCKAAGDKPIKIQLYPSQNEANLALTSGRASAIMADSVPLAYEGQLSNGKFELAPGQDYDPAPLGIAIPNDSPLGPALAAAMKAIVEDGSLAQLLEKWNVPASDVPASPDLVK